MTANAKMETLYTELTTATTTAQRKSIFEMMKTLYEKYACVRELWNLVETARNYVNKFVRIVKKKLWYRASKYDEFLVWNAKPVQGETFYLLEIRNNDSDTLIASKVGTSKDIVQRMRDEIKSYTKSYGVQVKLIVNRCIKAIDHAQTIRAESLMRAHYISKYPHSFIDNDRFHGVTFDMREADKILFAQEGLWA